MERPPANLDLEKDAGDGVGESLGVMARGGARLSGTFVDPPARACGPSRASLLETRALGAPAG